ncbi:MAG: HDIG domain-containing metalloprotein [Planctomycetota bacterium]
MRIFPAKKSRTSRLVNLKTGTWAERIGDQLTHGDVSLRLVICLLFLTVLVFAIASWKSPFPHRLGDDAPNGILAQIDFDRVNLRKTDLAQLERERRVPMVFRYSADGPELRNLPYELRKHLFDIVTVTSFEGLSADTRAAFGWVGGGVGVPFAPANPEFEAGWRQLRDALGTDTAERKIDEWIGEFSQLTTPLITTGVLDPAEIARQELRLEAEISVISRDDERSVTNFKVADLLLNEMLKSTGNLGAQWKSFTELKPHQTLLERWLQNRVSPTLKYDPAATTQKINEERRQTPPVRDIYKRGALLVAPGSVIDEETLEILRAQYDTIERQVHTYERIIRILTVMALLIVLGGMNGYHVIQNEPRLATNVGRLTVYLAAVTVTTILGRWLSFDPWRAEAVPILCVVMILAIAYNQVLAALTGFSMTLVVTLANGRSVGEFVVLMSAVAASVVPLNQVSNRMKLVKVGFWAAVAYFIVTWGVNIVESQQLDRLWTDRNLLTTSLQGAGWCFLTGFLVSGGLPFIENLFGVVTDISLLELSDVSHPLLQELVQRAPGTYSHSNGVATIAETAADAIGANGLLCRVGAYYHDVGKMLKPQYFVENMIAGQVSRHEALNPAMSALVIIGHVKDGVELAQQHNIPRPLIDFIEQHHGTTLVEYFFHAATKQAESKPDHRFEVQESTYRYPGPRPQSREAAVLMVADAVEGASRTLAEPTPKRIETLVHEIAMKRLLDGQFDECSLTLSELAIVEDSLTKSLIGIHHGRIKYPEQKTA